MRKNIQKEKQKRSSKTKHMQTRTARAMNIKGKSRKRALTNTQNIRWLNTGIAGFDHFFSHQQKHGTEFN
jgi:hypothetical protein